MYLLDTHAIIWYVSGNTELSAKARQLMDSRKCFLVMLLFGKSR